MEFVQVGRPLPQITEEMVGKRHQVAIGHQELANVYTAFYDQGRKEFLWVWSYMIGTPWQPKK